MGLHLRQWMVVMVAPAVLAACSSTPTEEGNVGVSDRDVAASAVASGSPSEALLAEIKNPAHPAHQRSIYFDFDRYEIKPEYQSLVVAHAQLMQKYPTVKVLIQGNADERGSREYNLALGQKRAEAVKQALAALGVAAERIEAVSLGEEKPVCTERNESCYAQNRRADILYEGEF
ncbi:peptidoglycan-associated lipoprotein Pal [Hydrogenophilus thermoluteolus]|nr:peptidoglycan-associated lipoprotein Pal [Hydrogenophilus thermoluteolus]MBW7656318.1 peptidoglycan-associated lipoprotein Pal [Hydrogenophilus thermoluteolus]HNQ48700.1 peptidoglycan-associated lipoprotein Pal [Hydrogenophilus thermoluteolus]